MKIDDAKKILQNIFDLGIDDSFSKAQLTHEIAKTTGTIGYARIRDSFEGMRMSQLVKGEKEGPFHFGPYAYILIEKSPLNKAEKDALVKKEKEKENNVEKGE